MSEETQIVPDICVDWTRTPEEALKATGRKVYVDENFDLRSVAREGSERVDFGIFYLRPFVKASELRREYACRNLRPAGLIELAALNEADPNFGAKYPHATLLQTLSKNYFLAFGQFSGEEDVTIGLFAEPRCFLWYVGVVENTK